MVAVKAENILLCVLRDFTPIHSMPLCMKKFSISHLSFFSILGFNRPTISQTATLPPQGPAIPSFPGQHPPPYPNSQPPVMPPPSFPPGSQVSAVPPPLPPRRPPMPASEPATDATAAAAFTMPNILKDFPMLNDLK